MLWAQAPKRGSRSVSIRVEGGYVGRCLLCGTTGPLRGNGEDARRVMLLEQMVRDEE
jgi:hypothetical protein